VKRYTDAELPPAPIHLRVGDTRLTGGVGELFVQGRVSFRYSKLRPKHQLDAWIRNLALAVMRPERPWVSYLVGRPDRGGGVGVIALGTPQNAAEILEQLVGLYWEGLSRPLLFFPLASHAYAFRRFRDNYAIEQENWAINAARSEWRSRFGGEGDDPHIRKVLGDGKPMERDFRLPGFETQDERFAFDRLALEIFEPLIRHRSLKD
jgi:exodeoxyribonuclease V gamma subunit